MIIEFTGCTGAGKSTRLDEIRLELIARGHAVFTPLQFFLGRKFAGGVHSRLQNLILDVIVLPALLPTYLRNHDFLNYAFHKIFAYETPNAHSFFSRVNLIRSVARKVTVHFLLELIGHDNRIVLVDEGTIHISHVIFGGRRLQRNELAFFLGKASWPDVLVCVKSPTKVLLDRTFSRPDPPLPRASCAILKKFVETSAQMYEELVRQTAAVDKVLVLSGTQTDERELHAVIERICNVSFQGLKFLRAKV